MHTNTSEPGNMFISQPPAIKTIVRIDAYGIQTTDAIVNTGGTKLWDLDVWVERTARHAKGEATMTSLTDFEARLSQGCQQMIQETPITDLLGTIAFHNVGLLAYILVVRT